MRYLILSVALACCTANPSDPPDAGVDPDGPTGSNDGELPPLRAQVGVAYVAHFNSGELRSYRLDTNEPAAGPVIDLGVGAHDLAIDVENRRLAVVSDVGRWVRLYSIDTPETAGAAIDAPVLAGEVTFESIPRFVTLDPYRDRLYVITADPDQSPLEFMELHALDTSDPAAAKPISGWPVQIPVTVSFALDAVRAVLFVVDLKADTLTAYDVGGDRFEALDGEPIALTAVYPQENQFAFQARGLTADVRRNRLVAARSQSALSELIAFDYPPDIPTAGARYRDFVTMDELVMIPDGFDVDVALDSRPNLLDAYSPAVDQQTGAVFLSTDAWNGGASSAAVATFGADASLGRGCDEVPGEGFGCFLRSYAARAPGSYLRTDGAICADATHQRVLATSIDVTDETAPGAIHVFSYSGDLMSAVLPAGGGDLASAAFPIGAVCH